MVEVFSRDQIANNVNDFRGPRGLSIICINDNHSPHHPFSIEFDAINLKFDNPDDLLCTEEWKRLLPGQDLPKRKRLDKKNNEA